MAASLLKCIPEGTWEWGWWWWDGWYCARRSHWSTWNDCTSAQEDEEPTVPIITEAILDAASTLVQLTGNQQLVKQQATQSETFLEELITKVCNITEKNNSLNHQLQDCAFSFNLIESNDKMPAYYTCRFTILGGVPSCIHACTPCHLFQMDAPLLLWMNNFLQWLNLIHNDDLAIVFKFLKVLFLVFSICAWLDVLHD